MRKKPTSGVAGCRMERERIPMPTIRREVRQVQTPQPLSIASEDQAAQELVAAINDLRRLRGLPPITAEEWEAGGR